MIEQSFNSLLALDTIVFYWINQGQRNPFFDRVMPIITEFDYWRIPLLILWLLLFFLGGSKGKITAVLLALLVGGTDYSNSFFIKPLFGRIRPCHVLSGIHTFWPCPRSLSFPSNHVANCFAAAFLFSFSYPRGTPFFLFIALVAGYSRVYVGEHYPLDVLGGLLLGGICATVILVIWFNIRVRLWGKGKNLPTRLKQARIKDRRP
jgi:undecaprenyl-diphosphatase